MKVDSLKLLEKLDKDSDQYEKYKKAVKMFNDETIADALEIIQGMGHAIDGFVREEMTKRDLKTLKAEFLE